MNGLESTFQELSVEEKGSRLKVLLAKNSLEFESDGYLFVLSCEEDVYYLKHGDSIVIQSFSAEDFLINLEERFSNFTLDLFEPNESFMDPVTVEFLPEYENSIEGPSSGTASLSEISVETFYRATRASGSAFVSNVGVKPLSSNENVASEEE